MVSIKQRLSIAAPIEKVYQALTSQEGLSGWWTTDTKAEPEIGSVATFRFGPEYHKEMKVTELKSPTHVKWLCIEAIDEWMGSTISFDLEQNGEKSTLTFAHDEWKQYSPTYAVCTYDWAQFLRSLKLLCETGKGRPYPTPFD